MPIRCRAQAEKDIGACESVFVTVIHEAHETFYSHCGPIAALLGGGTKASLIRDLALDSLARFAAIDPSFTIKAKGGAVTLRRGGFCFRLKALDDRKRAKPPRTVAGRRFHRNLHEEQGALELGDEPLTAGYLGYGVNNNDLHRPPIFFVVNGHDGRHAWEPLELSAIDVTSAGAGVGAQIGAQEDDTQPPSRARVKKLPEKKRQENG